jgi:hypothetical protein
LLGFLVYNAPPAGIYLGDCGSMLTGLVLSSLTLVVSFQQPGTVNLTVAVALLFVPFLDTALAIARRTLNGGNFMAADRGHVHHRLLDRGFSVWQALGFLAGLSMGAGLMAWLSCRSGHELITWISLGALVSLLVRVRLIGHEEWGLVTRLGSQLIAAWSFRPLRGLGDSPSQSNADPAVRSAPSFESPDFPATIPFLEGESVQDSPSDARQPSPPTRAA